MSMVDRHGRLMPSFEDFLRAQDEQAAAEREARYRVGTLRIMRVLWWLFIRSLVLRGLIDLMRDIYR